MPAEDSLEFACPQCGEANQVVLEPEDGARQDFVVDCWVCCRPIRVELDTDSGRVEIRLDL